MPEGFRRPAHPSPLLKENLSTPLSLHSLSLEGLLPHLNPSQQDFSQFPPCTKLKCLLRSKTFHHSKGIFQISASVVYCPAYVKKNILTFCIYTIDPFRFFIWGCNFFYGISHFLLSGTSLLSSSINRVWWVYLGGGGTEGRKRVPSSSLVRRQAAVTKAPPNWGSDLREGQ